MPKTQKQLINYQIGDKIQYKHPNHGWIDAIFEGFHTPGLAPAGCRWSFIEVSVNGKLHKAYSLNQIKISEL
ncbi:MAG: hypothetical protein RLZZ184_8 [Cyanobacteriota bacterium]|jgi:hypothetical protein|nr:hypothetical protein [Bacteroidota bacterium]